jgi:hypothetical protein
MPLVCSQIPSLEKRLCTEETFITVVGREWMTKGCEG